IIEELDSPSTHQLGGRPNASGYRGIAEGFVLAVVVERKHFLVYVRNEQINPSVLIIISGVHAHARARSAGCAIRHSCKQALFFEFPSSVDKQNIWLRAVGYEEVHPPVVVDVAGHYSPRLRHRSCDP